MTSPHGTIARYANGKCHCEKCRLANKIYKAKYRARGATTRKFVPAYHARQHLHFLLTHGWSARKLAEHLGLEYCTIQAIANTRKRIEARTEERILAAHTLGAPYVGKNVRGHRSAWQREAEVAYADPDETPR